MKNAMRLESVRGLLVCVALTALVACGGDDEGGSGAGGTGNTGGTGGSTGGSGGSAGMTGGSGGMGGSSGGMGGGGGMGGLNGLIPECSEPIPMTAVMCGGTACAMPVLVMGIDLCGRPCCVTVDGAETCGTKNTGETPPTDCAPLPPSDPRCPDYMEMSGTMREGCCDDENNCGIISTTTGGCITASPFVPTLPMPPIACDGGGDDAGI